MLRQKRYKIKNELTTTQVRVPSGQQQQSTRFMRAKSHQLCNFHPKKCLLHNENDQALPAHQHAPFHKNSVYLPEDEADQEDGDVHFFRLQWVKRSHLRKAEDAQERDEHERVNDLTHFLFVALILPLNSRLVSPPACLLIYLQKIIYSINYKAKVSININ